MNDTNYQCIEIDGCNYIKEEKLAGLQAKFDRQEELTKIDRQVINNMNDESHRLKATITEQANTITVLKNANREIAEWNAELKKLKDMQNECDTCIRQDCEVAGLEKENKKLKGKLSKAEKEASEQKSLAQAHHRLEKRYEEQLSNQPKLNRAEVEKIFEGHAIVKTYGMGILGMATKIVDEEPFITAILNLAYDKDRIVNYLKILLPIGLVIKGRCIVESDYEQIANEIIGGK